MLFSRLTCERLTSERIIGEVLLPGLYGKFSNPSFFLGRFGCVSGVLPLYISKGAQPLSLSLRRDASVAPVLAGDFLRQSLAT